MTILLTIKSQGTPTIKKPPIKGGFFIYIRSNSILEIHNSLNKTSSVRQKIRVAQ